MIHDRISQEPQFVFREDWHWWDQWNDVRDDQPHPDPQIGPADWAAEILPLCGCGNPEIVTEAMAAYLHRVETIRTTGSTQIRDDQHLADYLLASMADSLGLTEHGTSIYWCWLTIAGSRWLQLSEVGA